MIPCENTRGIQKKFLFIRSAVQQYRPHRILDIGCGTGAYITFPLAKAFPEIEILGIDSDTKSIEYANSLTNCNNLRFSGPNAIETEDNFDMIIASEIIEHVDNPFSFLGSLRSIIPDKGVILLTLPNGYGPSEIMTCINVLYLLVRRKFVNRAGIQRTDKRNGNIDRVQDTLAISPHINFFSYWKIKRVIRDAGFDVIQYRARTFLAGFILNRFIKGKAALNLNARIADELPSFLVSGWMFIISKSSRKPSVNLKYHRNIVEKVRKALNETLYKI